MSYPYGRPGMFDHALESERASLCSTLETKGAAHLVTWIESCRDLGRGALREAQFEVAPRYLGSPVVTLEDALDILDREIDNILGRLESLRQEA